MTKTNAQLSSLPMPCDPFLVSLDGARQLFGFVCENTLEEALEELGVKPTRVKKRVCYHIDDLRAAALRLREQSYAEDPE